jgi:hypothetical protein
VSDPDIVLTGLDVRAYRRASDAEREQMMDDWLQRFADAALSDDDRDLPPNERQG